MNMTKKHTKHRMERFQGLALRDAGGSTVTCESGSVWLTMEGDSRDIVLAPGESFTVDRAGLTLLAAQQPSVVQVRAKNQSHGWWESFIDFIDRNYGPAAIRPARKWVY
jgi:ferric-dicitrate binding protein FerR (iron transport regulator)